MKQKFLYYKIILSISIISIVTFACNAPAPEVPDYDNRNAREIFIIAEKQFKERDFEEAAELYLTIVRQYPYSQEAKNAAISAAHAYYEIDDFVLAETNAKRFINEHPGNSNIPKAYYIIALSNYDQINDSKRDQQKALEAEKALERLINFFPQSKYTRQARFKLRLVKDIIAAKEMEIARYYLDKKLYIAAINRFKNVTEKHHRTKHVEEALYRITECYIALGINAQAKKSASILGYNYPKSKWYKRAYALLYQYEIIKKRKNTKNKS